VRTTALAAVCTSLRKPLEVVDLIVEAPRAGEVAVRMIAAGICASDLSVQKGDLPGPLPIVLGHEGAGVVTAVGAGVEQIVVGDHVAVCAMPQCGRCRRCVRGQTGLCERADGVLFSGAQLDGSLRFRTVDGIPVAQMVAAGTFAESVVVPAISVVRLPREFPFAPAALLGCAVLTGMGAARNTAAIRPGDTVAVLGCGSVGLSAIQGARLAGAGRIVAIDLIEAKLGLARTVGATDVVGARDADVVAAVKDLTAGRGAEVTIEAVGAQATVDAAIRMTDRGGEVVFVGAGGPAIRIDIPQFRGLVGSAKTFKGCLFGAADIHRDIPQFVEYYRTRELLLDELVSRTFGLHEINDGFAAVAAGELISAVVRFDLREAS
jgi:Zn-dependent alcohol dehydrogenase